MSRQLFCVALYFSERCHDLVHILLVAEQCRLRNPNCFPCGALRIRKWLLQEGVSLLARSLAQAFSIFAISENVQFVERGIARLVGDAFRVYCLNKAFGRNTSELLLIKVKNVGVLSIAGATLVHLLRGDPRDFAQFSIEYACVLMAAARLLVETPELRAKHCALPFAQAIVRSINKVAIKPLTGHAAAIMHGTGSPLKGVVVRDNDATFAGGHQLA